MKAYKMAESGFPDSEKTDITLFANEPGLDRQGHGYLELRFSKSRGEYDNFVAFVDRETLAGIVAELQQALTRWPKVKRCGECKQEIK